MRQLIIYIFLLVTLTSCATISPICDLPSTEEKETVKVIIYRPSAMYGLFYPTPFSINNCRIQSLRNNSFLIYELPAGNHRIAAERHAMSVGGDAVISGNFEAGKTYYLHYSMSAGSSYYAPGLGAGFTTSTQFYITTKQHALDMMPMLESQNF